MEAGPRILAGLPAYIGEETLKTLHALGVEALCGERVVEVTPERVRTASGREVPADFTVWAAGIRCAAVLADLDGLEANRLNQLVVGNYQSVGTLMGFITGGTLRLEGLLAKLFYISLEGRGCVKR